MSKTGYFSAPAGMDSAKLFTLNTDTVVANGTATSVTAGSNDTTFYTVLWSDSLANGSYRLVMYDGGVALAGLAQVAVGDTTVTTPSASGDEITVLPVVGVVPDRVSGTSLSVFIGETTTLTIPVVDADGDAVDTTGMTLSVVFEDKNTRTDVAFVADGGITKTTTTVSFAVPSAVTTTDRQLLWSLRNTTTVLLHGVCSVEYAAKAD